MNDETNQAGQLPDIVEGIRQNAKMAVISGVVLIIAGFIAGIDTVLAFEYATVLALAAFLIVLFFFHEPSKAPKSLESRA